MTRGAGGSHGVMHDGPAQWKVEIEETQSLELAVWEGAREWE